MDKPVRCRLIIDGVTVDNGCRDTLDLARLSIKHDGPYNKTDQKLLEEYYLLSEIIGEMESVSDCRLKNVRS